MFKRLSFFLSVACLFGGSPLFAQQGTHRLAVVPFYAPFNPDYGVFMADRIAFELYRHAYLPALGRSRFVLIETDTLEAQLQLDIQKAKGSVSTAVLEALRRRIPANYLLTGVVSSAGINEMKMRLLDLETGKIIWGGAVRDNTSWVWTRANRSIGEIPADEVRHMLGFGVGEKPPPAPETANLPSQILLQPLYTTGFEFIAADCELKLRESVIRDGLFSVVPGTVKGPHNEQRFPRLGGELRRQARETTLADAVLCGNLLTLGKDGSAENIGIVLRLVDVATGRWLWMGNSSGRRVWRWDKQADVIAGTMASLVEELAQFGAGAAEGALAELRANAQTGNDWVSLGDAYLARGLLRQAEEIFNKAIKFPEVKAHALDGMGQIYLRRGGNFDKAVATLKEAMLVDPNYLFAYCHLAQAYLERDMADGEKIAQQALARDPTFGLAHRVLGDWYVVEEDNVKAANHYEKYLNLEPEDVEVAAKLGQVLLRIRDYSRIDRLVAPILRSKPESIALLPVLAIKSRRVRQFGESNRLFLRFLTQVNSRERLNYENIQTLLPEAEQTIYNGLAGREREVYEDRFWRQKDPDLSNEYNERQLEHFERVWVARHEFGQDVYPWDKRGEVFIRYGQPDYRSRSGWISSLPSARVQEIKERAYRDLYQNPPEGELIGPVFPIRSGRSQSIVQEQEQKIGEQDETTFTLEEGLQRERISGILRTDLSQEAYAPVTAQQDQSIVPWESWVYTDVEGGILFDFTKETGGGAGYNFAPLPAIPPSILRSSIRLAEYSPEIVYQRSINNKPDDFRPANVLSLKTFYYDVTDFRGDGRNSRVDVSFGIPLADLMVVTDGRQPQVVLERGVALADSSFTVVYRQGKKIQLDADTTQVTSDHIVDALRQDVPPGLYHLTLTVTDVMSGRTGKLQRDVRIDDYTGNKLSVSDLMLVQSLSDTVRDIRFRRGAWEVVPNPSRMYRSPNLLAFYCEIYHLKVDSFGQTHYKVTTGVKAVDRARPMPLGPMQQPEVALSYEQVGNQDWERLPLEVDLSNAQPGPNRLVVVIEDLNTGEKVARETFFEYIR